MKKMMLLALSVCVVSVAEARIPVTSSETIMDQNIDGAVIEGKYKVADDCNDGLFRKPQSKGYAVLRNGPSFEDSVSGVISKKAELTYTYSRRQGSDKYELKRGTLILNKLRKITEQKKVDNEVVEQKERIEADFANVIGDLADDDSDKGNYRITFMEDGRIQLHGDACDKKVTLTPTTDELPPGVE